MSRPSEACGDPPARWVAAGPEGQDTELQGGRYDVHGADLELLCGTPAIASTLADRLRWFAAGDRTGPAELRIRFVVVPEREWNAVTRPAGRQLPAGDALGGEAFWMEEEDLLFIEIPGVARIWCEAGDGLAQITIHQAALHRLWLISHAVFEIPLLEMLKRRGLYSLHAACLSRGGRGIVVAGSSGAGKSTLSVALVRAGLDFLSDDTTFLRSGSEGVQALAFPEEISVCEGTTALFPDLQGLSLPYAGARAKRRISPGQLWNTPVVSTCRPGLLVFPRIVDRSAGALVPLGKDEAFLELLPNLLLTELTSTRACFDAFGELVHQCACYRLESGRDLEQSAALLRRELSL